LHVWEKVQNAITFAYGIHLQKKIYGQNWHNETYAMALVSYNSENFEILAFLDPFWIKVEVFSHFQGLKLLDSIHIMSMIFIGDYAIVVYLER
jgi:hypothetical protein